MTRVDTNLTSRDWLGAVDGEKGPIKANHVPRILLADDAAAARVLMSALLRRMNVKVDVAQNGEEVLWLCQRFVFDLILLDIDMPVMDGFVTARCIRESEQPGQRTPIIAVSGFLAATANQRQEHCYFDGTVAKPVTLARLWTAISRLLPAGTISTEPTSLPRAANAEVPLVNLAALRARQIDEAGEAPEQVLLTTVNELRRLASILQQDISNDEGRESARMAAVELDHLAERTGASRLQRRASAMASIAPQAPQQEWQAQGQAVIACTIATINEFKKLVNKPL